MQPAWIHQAAGIRSLCLAGGPQHASGRTGIRGCSGGHEGSFGALPFSRSLRGPTTTRCATLTSTVGYLRHSFIAGFPTKRESNPRLQQVLRDISGTAEATLSAGGYKQRVRKAARTSELPTEEDADIYDAGVNPATVAAYQNFKHKVPPELMPASSALPVLQQLAFWL